jgi:hypothetical protein
VAVAEFGKRALGRFSQLDLRPQPSEVSEDAEFSLEPSQLVRTMVAQQKVQPDLSPFNSIYSDMLANGMVPDAEDRPASVDFNKFFSDPNFFKFQYMAEILEDIKRETAAKKQAAREAKARAWAERAALEREKQALTNAKSVSAERDVMASSAAPPPVPTRLCMPPPKGQAKHGDIPISLQFTQDAQQKAQLVAAPKSSVQRLPVRPPPKAPEPAPQAATAQPSVAPPPPTPTPPPSGKKGKAAREPKGKKGSAAAPPPPPPPLPAPAGGMPPPPGPPPRPLPPPSAWMAGGRIAPPGQTRPPPPPPPGPGRRLPVLRAVRSTPPASR